MELVQKSEILISLFFEMNTVLQEAVYGLNNEAYNAIANLQSAEADRLLKMAKRLSCVGRTSANMHYGNEEFVNIPKVFLKNKLLYFERLKGHTERSKKLIEQIKQSTSAKDFDDVEVVITALEGFFFVNKPNDSNIVQE